MARIRLENTFAYPVSVIVNDRIYHLNTNETRFTEPLTLGDVSYEVLSDSVAGGRVQGPRTTKVTAGTPLTISVYTR